MVKKILNILLVTKMLKKIRLLCIFGPNMSVYKRDFDQIKCMYFLIKDETYI